MKSFKYEQECVEKYFKQVIDYAEGLSKTIEEMTQREKEEIGSIMSVVHIPSVRCNLEDKLKEMLNKGDTSWEEAEKLIAKFFLEEDELHKKNNIAIENNQKLKVTLFNHISKLGIKSTYYGYRSSRCRNKTLLTRSFVDDLGKEFITADGYNISSRSYFIKEWKQRFETERIKRIEDLEKLRKEELNKNREYKLAYFKVKFDLNADDNLEKVRDTLLSKNKYLSLGFWIEKAYEKKNSFYKTKGLTSFKQASSVDNDIISSISSSDVYNLRDNDWSFTALYELVEKETPKLYNDYCTFREYFWDELV